MSRRAKNSIFRRLRRAIVHYNDLNPLICAAGAKIFGVYGKFAVYPPPLFRNILETRGGVNGEDLP